jgi:threonine efflux protein
MSYALTLGGVAAVHLLAVATPGPAFVVVSRVAVAQPRGVALSAALGAAMAAFGWAVAASVGVAALLASAATLFLGLKLIGGAYLVWLGVQAWRHAGVPPPTASAAATARMRPMQAWRLGVTTNLSNPKVIIFFGSIFVALFAPGTPAWVRIAALGIVACNEALWYTLLAVAFSSPPVQSAYRAARRWVDRVTGTLMVGFGARLLAAVQG